MRTEAEVPTYASRICFDADSHLMETFEWLASFAEPEVRDKLPPLDLASGGPRAAEAIRKARARLADPVATAELECNVIGGPKGWSAFGAFDPGERSRALDRLGLSAQLVFSTFAAVQFMPSEDPVVRYGGARAHNRGITEFCGNDPRLLAVAIVPLDDPARAAVEVDFALRRGCRAVWVPAAPAGERSPGHPDLDPIWARLAEARVPFVVHVGSGTRVLRPAYNHNGRKRPTDWLGGGENLRFKDFMVIPFAPQMFLTALVYDGVLERFPALKGGAIELGAGWVPDFLSRLDHAGRTFHKSDPTVRERSLAPSEYIRRQVRFTPFPFEDTGALIVAAGEDLFLFSTDYPHPEGGHDPLGKFEASLDRSGIGENARDKFYARNFRDMMSLPA